MAKKKSCNTGYGCGASCISITYICKKDFPEGVSVSIDSARKTILNKLPEQIEEVANQEFTLSEERKKILDSITDNQKSDALEEYLDTYGKEFSDEEKERNKENGLDPNLKKEDIVAVIDYTTDDSYTEINNFLRSKEMDSRRQQYVAENIRLLDDQLQKMPTSETTQIYRGVPVSVLENVKVGQIFREDGYMSTTDDRETAKIFGEAMMEIKLRNPKAKNLTAINQFSEQELLVPRGISLKLTEVSKDGLTYIFEEI